MILALVTALTVALIGERIIHACVALVFYLFNHGPDHKSVWFVGTLLQSLSALIGSTVSAFLRLFTFSIRGIFWTTIVLILWGLLYACGRYSAHALISFQAAYNTNVGGTANLFIVLPFRILQLIWDGFVPLYNLFVYLVKTVPSRVLIENVLRNWNDFEDSMLNLGLFSAKLAGSLYNYIIVILWPPDSFDPNLRLLDLITPLGYFRLAVSYLLKWLGETCAVATSLLDILAYPFLDINFGLGVHSLVNALLALFVQVPAVTKQRCAAGGSVVYCLPDFAPVIELAVNGIRSFGILVDNWLDVIAIIMQSVLTNTSPVCNGWTATDLSSDIFGGNETIVVGIDANRFARTDGWSAAVYSRSSTQTFQSVFPFAVNINLGIALVSVTTTIQGLLGCTCTDQAYGLQLLCAVAPLDQLTDSYVVPVEFDVPTTSFYMGCGRSVVRLESIRWPVTRYTSPNSGMGASPVAEAALYMRPACSSEHIDVVCVETFRLAGCYPYCMALWTKGYTGSMVLRSGPEWSNTVAMVSRDCGLHSWDVQSGQIASMTANLRQNSGVRSTWMDAEVQLNSSQCVYAPNTFSRMLRNVTNAYSSYRSVRMGDQPFAFAGDLILTAVNTVGDNWGIDVQRIWGNQVRAISLHRAVLNRAASSSVRGPHRSSSSMHCPMRSSGSVSFSRSSSISRRPSSSSACLCVIRPSPAGLQKCSDRIRATCRRVSSDAVRFGRISNSCMASAHEMSLRGCFLPICFNLKRAPVSGLARSLASVCEARLRSLSVSRATRSKATMFPSASVRRRSICILRP